MARTLYSAHCSREGEEARPSPFALIIVVGSRRRRRLSRGGRTSHFIIMRSRGHLFPPGRGRGRDRRRKPRHRIKNAAQVMLIHLFCSRSTIWGGAARHWALPFPRNSSAVARVPRAVPARPTDGRAGGGRTDGHGPFSIRLPIT